MNSYKNNIRIYKTILIFFITVIIVTILGLFNRYILAPTNLPLLFLIVMSISFLFALHRIPKSITFPFITFSMLIFIIYMFLRWNTESNGVKQVYLIGQYDHIFSGLVDIADQLICYGLFICAALIYYNKGKFPFALWMIISGYTLAAIIRRTLIFNVIREGGNLSVGYALITLVPFIFLKKFDNKSKMRLVPHVLIIIFIIWILLLSARTSTLSLLYFYICLIAWPIITRNRFNFFAFLGVTITMVMVLPIVYLILTPTGVLDPLNDISLQVFQKRIGTRFNIWSLLLTYIVERPLFGYGTENASIFFAAPDMMARDNLSSHSTYFELLLRLGIIGFILYLAMILCIWSEFWKGRDDHVVKVAGSYLLSTLIFMSSQPYLIFSPRLWNGIGWIILGIGGGACLRAKRGKKVLFISEV